jgi:hypothetical protein
LNALKKIGFWLRTEYGGSVKTKKSQVTTFKKMFDKAELDPPAPTRPRAPHFYSTRYYAERIKPRFNAKWAAVLKLAQPPAKITVQNQVIKEAWEAESDEFRAEVMAALDSEHKVALEAYATAVTGEIPTTPEGFQM